MTRAARLLDGLRPAPETAAAFVALSVAELAVLAAYVAATPGDVTAVRYLLYPFAWLNAAALAVWRVDLAPASRRRRVLAAAAGAGYFLALAWVGGLVSPAHHAGGVTVYWGLPPGWGPLVVAIVGPARFAPTPYQAVGYLALAYLVAAAVRDADASLTGLVVGAFSCVSCTLPLLAAAVSAVAGGTVGVAASAAWSYDLSTLAFLSAVCLLAWRPDAALLSRLR
ncbi:DUF7546 family protein [Halobacterium yunchengense]|uniref:DUF7546 family protein n=1 Tax=Halobacterium yunchengense TaxID=3108497 RepID=UPI0030087CFD